MISNSGPVIESNQRPTPPPRRPPTYWVAHLALILAVAAALIFGGLGDRRPSREWEIGIQTVLVLLFAAQFIIARRIGGAFGNGTPYGLITAGALCVLARQFVAAESSGIALTILSALFFVSGIIMLVLQVRRVRRSQ